MELRQLEYFCAVAEAESISAMRMTRKAIGTVSISI